jgi:hypothetical protein
MIFNPLSTSFIQNKLKKFDEQGSDIEDSSFSTSKFIAKKPTFRTAADNSDSEDEYPNPRKYTNKKTTFVDSDDSGDENPYPNGNRDAFRVPQMADFFKFQQKKMPGLTGKLFNRGRGSSFDGREDSHLPKGYHSKMVATAYTSDTE